jgi:hypothetical protein
VANFLPPAKCVSLAASGGAGFARYDDSVPNLVLSAPAHDSRRSAAISRCGRYRWWLRRSFARGGPGRVVCFLMLNPSTADHRRDDPTIRRCLGFARAWGYPILEVRNLFAWRATDPRELLTAPDPTGGRRGDRELRAVLDADLVVAAWGAWVPFARDRKAVSLLAGRQLMCLGRTRSGRPRHPLYVRGTTRLEVFDGYAESASHVMGTAPSGTSVPGLGSRVGR